MATIYITDIFNIYRGQNLSRLKSEINEGYPYMVPKSLIVNNGFLMDIILEKTFLLKGVNEEVLTQEGDILFRMVGNPEFIYISKKYEGFLVTGNYLLLRLKRHDFLRRAIFYMLQTKEDYLSNLRVGTTEIKSLSITHIENLKLDMPNIEIQEVLDKTLILYEKEIELFRLKESFYKNFLIKTLREEQC